MSTSIDNAVRTQGGWRFALQPRAGAPALLLLHGTGSSLHSWAGLWPLLAPHYSLLAPDLPGHGGSPRLSGGASLPGFAEALQGLLAALDFAPTLVAGHSAGAAVMLALDLPAQGLLALNAALQPLPALFTPAARLVAALPGLPQLAARHASRPAALQRLIASTGSRLSDAGVAHYRDLLSQPAHVAGTLAMMAGWDLRPLRARLPALRTPLWLAAATRDRTVPPWESRRLAAELAQAGVPARYVELAGLGHLAHEEAPAQVADLIAQLSAATAAATASARPAGKGR